MTPTTNEREALLRECYEWLFESKADGPRVSEGAIAKGYYTEAFAEFHNRLQAALTREQREGVERDAFIRGYKHGACHYIGGDSTEELHEAASWAADHQDEEAGNFGKPQQESQGAVANESLDAQGLCHKSGSPEWPWNCDCPNHARTTTPAPVDVRVPSKPLEVFGAGEWRYSETGQTFTATDLNEAAFVAYRALLDGQQAGVDDAMVERAINACCTSGAYFAPETDDEWRAVLQAALGGGGGGE